MPQDNKYAEQEFGKLFPSWGGMADRDREEEERLTIDPDNANTLAEFCRNTLRKDIDGQIESHRRFAKEAAYYGYKYLDSAKLENIFDSYLITIPVPKDVKQFFRIIIRECFDELV